MYSRTRDLKSLFEKRDNKNSLIIPFIFSQDSLFICENTETSKDLKEFSACVLIQRTDRIGSSYWNLLKSRVK